MDTKGLFKEVQYWELGENPHIFNSCKFEFGGVSRLLVASRTQLLALTSEWGRFSLLELPLSGVSDDVEIVSLQGFVCQKPAEDDAQTKGYWYSSEKSEETRPILSVAFQTENSRKLACESRFQNLKQQSIRSLRKLFPSENSDSFEAGVDSVSPSSGQLTPGLSQAPALGSQRISNPGGTVAGATGKSNNMNFCLDHRDESINTFANEWPPSELGIDKQHGGSSLHFYAPLPVHAGLRYSMADLGEITQNLAQVVKLDYTPLHIAFAPQPVPLTEKTEDLLFISGDDSRMHLFRRQKGSNFSSTSAKPRKGNASLQARGDKQNRIGGLYDYSYGNHKSLDKYDDDYSRIEPLGDSAVVERNLEEDVNVLTKAVRSASSDSTSTSTVSTSESVTSYISYGSGRRSSGSDFSKSVSLDNSSTILPLPQSNGSRSNLEDANYVSSGDELCRHTTGLSRSRQSGTIPDTEPTSTDPNCLFETVRSSTTSLGAFSQLNSPILHFECQPLHRCEKRRQKVQFVASACENGSLCVLANSLTGNVQNETPMIANFNGPLPFVRMLDSNRGVDCVDLVVGGSLGFAALVECSVETGSTNGRLSKPKILSDSTIYDSVLCGKVSDINWDGKDEIILGTYGQQLLAYGCLEEGGALDERRSTDAEARGTQYVKIWERPFAFPIFAIETGDFNQDGVDELVVNTLRGLHILQPDLQAVADSVLVAVEAVEQLRELSSACL